MKRGRRTGLTDEQKDQILHYDQLSEMDRKYLAYNVRTVIEKEIEDLDWLFTEMPEAFKRMRYRKFEFPIDAVIPKKKVVLEERLDSWITTLENIRTMVQTFEFRLFKRG